MAERLRDATSPYLRQHAGNPVDWWPWGPEAFAEARRRDVPVLLSVGYSACHWCHVMAHESFEDEAVARVLGESAVAIKVDREERPDIDAVYMAATVGMTGQGGWPMTCFLTPEGDPFHCGTYYPRDVFLRLVEGAARAWREHREDVVAAGRQVTAAVSGAELARRGPVTPDVTRRAVERLSRDFDPAHGGFGGAPKFPPSMTLEWLLRHHERTGSSEALDMAAATLTAMARGGLHDQLAGGFARYAVDATWTVPHFEKMLYDNALLLRAYTHWWRRTGHPLAERTARSTAGFLLRDLTTHEAGFAASLDADTSGSEGLTYVWTPEQLTQVLGPEDGAWAATVFAVTGQGTFEHGTSVLQLPADPGDAERLARVSAALGSARSRRPQPARDDTVIAAWNGLAIGALAEAGMALGDPRWVEAAASAADLILAVHLGEDGLRRTSRDGRAGPAAGMLDDHASLAEGLLLLAEASGVSRYRDRAGELLDIVLTDFTDGEGGFYDTPETGEKLIYRPRSETDNAEPGGLSAAASALLRYAAHSGSPQHREAGERALARTVPLALESPRFAGWALAAMESVLDGSAEVAITAGDRADDLVMTAWRHARPGQVTVYGAPDSVPLLADRHPAPDGRAQAFVCRDKVCAAPVNTPSELAALLRP